MKFSGMIGKVANKAISSSFDTKGFTNNILNKVNVPDLMNKIPGMDNPKLAPLKNDVQNVLNTVMADGTKSEGNNLISQIQNPSMDTTLLENMNSGLLGGANDTKAGYPKGQAKADNKDQGSSKVTSNMESKIKEISSKTGNDISMPSFDSEIMKQGENQMNLNIDLGGDI